MNEQASEQLNTFDNLDAVWVKKYRNNYLRVGGVINTTTVITLREEGQVWINRLKAKYSEVVFDMEPTKPQGAVCASLMLCWLRYAKNTGMNISFQNIPQDIERILLMSGVYNLLNIKSVKKKPFRQYDLDHS